MQLELGAKPAHQPIRVTNPNKIIVQKLNPFAALKTGFWNLPEMVLQGYKEIQVPCIGGECRFDYVFKVRPKINRNAPYKFRGNLIELHGFEQKLTKSDLLRDAKFLSYLGLTNYFSFAVRNNFVTLHHN